MVASYDSGRPHLCGSQLELGGRREDSKKTLPGGDNLSGLLTPNSRSGGNPEREEGPSTTSGYYVILEPRSGESRDAFRLNGVFLFLNIYHSVFKQIVYSW